MKVTMEENELIKIVEDKTNRWNKDNISRTKAYQLFYQNFPEMKWSFLASMVSRNAGWNMTDLKTSPFQHLLPERTLKRLFSTYERANWLIFSDAYPQLLLYQYSKQQNQSFFHLLPYFRVSLFMQKEWMRFLEEGDLQRIMIALIINEQNVIQKPVITHHYYKHKVFLRIPYLTQNLFYMNGVMFPTLNGELFGAYVHGFTNVTKRIDLGKRLAKVLFHKELYPRFWEFAKKCEHTGSRYDYEKYFKKQGVYSPLLRMVYPVIDHQDNRREDWYRQSRFKREWWKDVAMEKRDISNRLYIKKGILNAIDKLMVLAK